MSVYLLVVGLGISAFAFSLWKVFGPDYLRHRERKEKQQKLNDLFARIDQFGTPDQKARLATWRQRQISLELKQLETAQTLEMIHTQDVYAMLVAGNVDVAALERALTPGGTNLSSPSAEPVPEPDLSLWEDQSHSS